MLKDTILKYNKKYNNAPNNEKKNIIRELFYNFIIYSLFFKNEKYMIENEYRIVMPVCNSSTDEEENCYYRHKKGLIIPYIKFDLKQFVNYLFKSVHTYTKEEFEKNFVEKYC